MAQINTNDPLIENRKRIGGYAFTAGIVVMLVGLVASFQNQLIVQYGNLYYVVIYASLILGFILLSIGSYNVSRYGVGIPEKLASSLKGLDKRYRLYNFLLPVPHVLLTPYGITILLVKNQEGRIVADEKGWSQPTGVMGSVIRFTRAFSTEPLGNPPQDLEAQKKIMQEFILKGLPEDGQVPVDGMLIFTNPKADISILANPVVPTIALSKQPDALKNALRRDKRTTQLSRDVYDRLVGLFDGEAEEKTEKASSTFRFWRR